MNIILKSVLKIFIAIAVLFVLAWRKLTLWLGIKKNNVASADNVNFPMLEGYGDFFQSLKRSLTITYLHKLTGAPLDMKWIDGKFREKLCLVVSISNNCGGG